MSVMQKNTALFPLNTVVFPGGLLALRIFESRYLDMISDCMKSDTEFGVCALRAGNDTDSNASHYSIGTLVEIVDFKSLADGLLGVTVKGRCKFRIQTTRSRANSLLMADIERLPTEPAIAIQTAHRPLVQVVKRLIPEVHEHFGDAAMALLGENFQDAAWVGARLVEFLPFELVFKQQLLELQEPLQRLNRIGAALLQLDS